MVYFSFRVIDSTVGLVGCFIDLAVTDTLEAADPLQPGTKTTDTREHIKKSDCHRASDLFLYLLVAITSHSEDRTHVLVLIFVHLLALFLGQFFGGQGAEGVLTGDKSQTAAVVE